MLTLIRFLNPHFSFNTVTWLLSRIWALVCDSLLLVWFLQVGFLMYVTIYLVLWNCLKKTSSKMEFRSQKAHPPPCLLLNCRIVDSSRKRLCLAFPKRRRLLYYSSKRREEFLLIQQQTQPIRKYYNSANGKPSLLWTLCFLPIDIFFYKAAPPNFLPFSIMLLSFDLQSCLWFVRACMSPVAIPLLIPK